MQINGIEASKEQIWQVIQSQLESAKHSDSPDGYKKLCAGIAASMGMNSLGSPVRDPRQELVNLLKLEG